MTTQIVPSTPILTQDVQLLVEVIRTEIESGMERARLEMEQEKRLTYWNVGKHIKTHILENEARAEYGDYLFPVLVETLNIGRTDLYCSVQLYEEYPQIVHSNGQLTWSHLKALLPIEDKKLRANYEKQIIEEKLSVHDLRAIIRSDKALPSAGQANPVLAVVRTEPYVYQSKQIQGNAMVDLGFNFFIATPGTKTEVVPRLRLGAVPHYTYKAYVLEVIDGDTFWADIDLGFNNWTTQKLRFRGINAREINSSSGKSAKEYIEKKLKGCSFIVIKTYWRDKFSRYLADVFCLKQETEYEKVIQDGKFLNQELLDKGLAVKY